MSSANWIQQSVATGGAGDLVLGSSFQLGVTMAQAFGADASDIPYAIQAVENGAYLEAGLCDYVHSSTTITNRRPKSTFIGGTYDPDPSTPATVPDGAILRCDSSAEDYEAFLAGVPALHAASHATGQSDAIAPGDIGAAAVTHASTHASGQADEITPADIGAAAATHAAQHAEGGADELTPAALGVPDSSDGSVVDIVTVTQAEYDALPAPGSTTLYLICDSELTDDSGEQLTTDTDVDLKVI